MADRFILRKAYIPPAYRNQRVPGQSYARDKFPVERASLMKLVNQKPPPWTEERHFETTVMTAKSAVADLGLDPATSTTWAMHINDLVKNSAHEGEMRQRFFQRALNEGLDPSVRRVLFQRVRNLWNNHLEKSLVKVISIEELGEMVKAQPRGGTYHRRVPKEDGKGFRYYYDPDKYAQRKDAHHSGEEMRKYAMGTDLTRALEGAGEKGCSVEDLRTLAKKYGGQEVSALLKEKCSDEKSGVSFKGGRFYSAPKKDDK